MKLSNQEIQTSIAELPANVQKAVITFDWGNEILNIGKRYSLHMDQIDAFRNESLMIILGKKSSGDYVSSLIKELDIKKNIAEQLVESANIKIFRELQKRAFTTETNEDTEIEKSTLTDDYLEPINHNDLRGPMAEEGVHLVDENNIKPQTNLQNEIDSMVEAPYIDSRSLESFEMSSSDRQEDISDNNIHGTESTLIFKDEFNQEIINSNSYNEPIDDSDLKGIGGHRTNTNILQTQNHLNPEHAFNKKISLTTSGRDFGQGNLNQSLDKHIMENPFIAKGDSLNVSPTEQEQIKEEGTFLQNLKNTEE